MSFLRLAYYGEKGLQRFWTSMLNSEKSVTGPLQFSRIYQNLRSYHLATLLRVMS